MADVKDDEAFKAAAHGLVLGCILIPLAHNVRIRKWTNVAIYSALIGFELYHIIGHVKDTNHVLGSSTDSPSSHSPSTDR